MLTSEDYILFLIGWFSFITMLFKLEKGIYDGDINKIFSYKQYAEDTFDDWIFTFISSLGLLLISPDIFLYLKMYEIVAEGFFWSKAIPFLIGAFGSVIFFGLYEGVKLFIDKYKDKIKRK